ncbi:MAG: AMP-binding protein [Pseudomonadota bacterium]
MQSFVGPPDKASLKRVIVALIAQELEKFRGATVPFTQWRDWTDDTQLTSDGLGFDSLGLLQVAGRTNQFFEMHKVGIEDYLLARPTIGAWVDLVAQALSMRWEHLTFQTAGSTGEPKPCGHPVTDLDDDAATIGQVFDGVERVVSLVPPQHIYGFIYTVRLPQLFGIELIDGRTMGPGQLAKALGEGALLVATPHLWRYALTSLGHFPDGTMGLTSTAPMPAELHNALCQSGITQLVEVYGSSETNGIGWRDTPDAFFKLFDWWQADEANGQLLRHQKDGSTIGHTFIDKLALDGSRHIKPIGRLDNAIQIGGLNVFPLQVRDAISAVDGVAEVTVRPFRVDGPETQRLKAFIVPAGPLDSSELELTIRSVVSQTLAAHEMPVQFAFGEELPTDGQGKLCDWGPSTT